MSLGVGQGHRGAPGRAADDPALDAQVLAQGLHVGDRVLQGVVGQLAHRGRGAAAALVELNDPAAFAVDQAAQEPVRPAAWAAVGLNPGHAVEGPGVFIVDRMSLANGQQTLRPGRRDGKIGIVKSAHGGPAGCVSGPT